MAQDNEYLVEAARVRQPADVLRLALGSSVVAAVSGFAVVGMSHLCHHQLPGLALMGLSSAPTVGLAMGWTLAIAMVTSRLRTAWCLRRSCDKTRRLGQYRLDEKIGEGGMGIVYKASHALLRRPAAIKVLPPDRAGEREIKRFEREVQLTSMLTHPNTIAIYDFGRTAKGSFYYAMEYVDGLTLQTLVEREGPQDPARVAHLLAQVAGALVEAHGAGLIHRDVKPANIMVCERGGVADVVKLLDFGLIKEVDERADSSRSDVHRIVGTPMYMCPEALTAPETIDPRSDLYAVGAVGYFLLTGAPPFSGKNLVEVCGQHLHTAPVRPSERRGTPIPRRLEALIMSCLAKSPLERPESAAALQASLLPLAASWTQQRAVLGRTEYAGRMAACAGLELSRTACAA
jgi:serine/threonine-protein kinase